MPVVITAKTAGFCFGVKRAVDTVYEEIKKGGDVYTFGEIIHNESVVEDLEKKGVKVIENLDEISRLKEGTVIIRSHGVAKNVKEKMSENRNIRIVDATCPFVKKIHETVEKESSEGKDIIIIGDPDHPEVLGITGYVKTRAYAINSREEAENFNADKDREMCLVSQTTFNLNKFKDLVEILSKKGYSIYVVNTVCSATRERQEEAVKLAGKVDAMIVIGGRHSSNTKKLYELCAGECNNTVLIQTLDDLDLDLTRSFPCVGITAGASTPKFIIEEVQNNVRGTEF